MKVQVTLDKRFGVMERSDLAQMPLNPFEKDGHNIRSRWEDFFDVPHCECLVATRPGGVSTS